MYGMAFYYSQINGECIFETQSLGTCLVRENFPCKISMYRVYRVLQFL